MRRVLLLLRHAKAKRGDPGGDDFDRALNGRGRAAASEIARAMRAAGLKPDLALCSPSRRTRETWDLVGAAIDYSGPSRYEPALYLADRNKLLEALHRAPDSARAIAVIGHNPGLGELAAALAGKGRAEALEAMRAKFPTGALAVITFDAAHWRDLAPGGGTLDRYLKPADLS